jgi:hypothetical protein
VICHAHYHAFEPAFELVDLSFDDNPMEGESLGIAVTARSRQVVVQDLLFPLDTNLEDVQPRKEVFNGPEHWTPAASVADLTAGSMRS